MFFVNCDAGRQCIAQRYRADGEDSYSVSTQEMDLTGLCPDQIPNVALALNTLINAAKADQRTTRRLSVAGVETTLNLRAGPGPKEEVIGDIPAESGPIIIKDRDSGPMERLGAD